MSPLVCTPWHITLGNPVILGDLLGVVPSVFNPRVLQGSIWNSAFLIIRIDDGGWHDSREVSRPLTLPFECYRIILADLQYAPGTHGGDGRGGGREADQCP